MKNNNILDIALSNEEPIVLSEVKNNSTIKYIGSGDIIDIYISTRKKFATKIIEKNILKIKEKVNEIDKKIVKDIFINNIKYELNLKEIYKNDNNASLISLDYSTIEVSNETSGENDIVGNMFEYESSILNKSKISIALYNKELEKEWKINVNPLLVNKKFSIKKNILKKQIKQFLDLKYEPNNNDTKEFIKMIYIKK